MGPDVGKALKAVVQRKLGWLERGRGMGWWVGKMESSDSLRAIFVQNLT